MVIVLNELITVIIRKNEWLEFLFKAIAQHHINSCKLGVKMDQNLHITIAQAELKIACSKAVSSRAVYSYQTIIDSQVRYE